MNKIKLSLLTLIFSCHVIAQDGNYYTTNQGNLNIDKLEEILSENIEANVNVLTIHNSLNPLDYLIAYLQWNRLTYLLGITIDDTHHVSCQMGLYIDEGLIRLFSCRSATANVFFRGSIPFTDVDLPQSVQRETFGRP
jgi:hypothetical protein